MRAADLLRRAGRQVVVLEARERAGGRVLTVRSPFDDGLHAEAGPIRIAGVHQAVLRAARSFGLTLTPFASQVAVVAIQVVAAIGGGGASRRADRISADDVWTQAALLDRYIGVLPDDLAEPAATADSMRAMAIARPRELAGISSIPRRHARGDHAHDRRR